MDEETAETQPTEEATETPDVETEPETFDREYVSKLRAENAKHRTRAKQADEYAHRLHAELVRQSGRLADPTDLEFDEEHLTDPDKLTQAIDSLLEAKPHFKSRKPVGDIGQGNRGPAAVTPPSLLGHIRSAMGMTE
jgi:hypothetical protein